MNCFADRWCSAWMEAGTAESAEFFLRGVAVGIAAMLLVVLVVLMLGRHRRARGISISGETGGLYVTQAAVREFVGAVMDEFSEAALHGMSLRRQGGGYAMRLALHVAPGAEVVQLVEDIRRRIIRQVTERMGLDAPLKVNVTVRSFTIPDKHNPPRPAGRNQMTGFPNLAGIIAPEDHD